MLETLFLIVVVGGLCLLSFRSKGFTPPKTQASDARVYTCFERVESLFVNASERDFFAALCRALPPNYHLHGKVRLEDIVRVKSSIKGQAKWALRSRVKSRHVDYLITDKYGAPIAAIELDGSSHNKAAMEADALKDGIFEASGLPLIRVRTRADFGQAAERIFARLKS